MFDLDKWKEIWATITRNKTRSVLTAFGVFWGLLMFIILVGYGNGFRKGMTDSLKGFATNSAFLNAGGTSLPYKGFGVNRHWLIDNRDLETLRRNVSGLDLLSPMLYDWGAVTRDSRRAEATLIGVDTDFFGIQQMEVLEGRLLNEIDIAQRRKVCIIGRELHKTLFQPGEDAIGQTIPLGGIYYTVVGVVKPAAAGIQLGGDPNESAYLPFTTMQTMKQTQGGFYNLSFTSLPGAKVSDVTDQVKSLLKASHDIHPDDQRAVYVFSAEEQLEMMNGIFLGVNLLIWVVGLGALFSGIIGISNIMLVTVRERMREIGIRRALGAKPYTIATQIMSESLVLTFIAGIGGFLLGVLLLQALSGIGSADGEQSMMTPYVSFNLALGAMALLVASGVLAGLMPAIKALKIKAIDAIRDE